MSLASTAIRAGLAFVVFAVSHSLLASLPVKRRVRSVMGAQRTDGAYRFVFNGTSVVSLAAFLLYLRTLPDRRLYRVSGIPRIVMFLGQLVCVWMLVRANRVNGFGQVTGIKPLWAYLRGQPAVPPVVQHPLPSGECLEGWTGPFRLSSHPNNYFVLLLYWFSPNMTIKWASIGTVTSLYMVLGSLHEDYRLWRAYGEKYTCYRAQVPHFRLRPIRSWVQSR